MAGDFGNSFQAREARNNSGAQPAVLGPILRLIGGALLKLLSRRAATAAAGTGTVLSQFGRTDQQIFRTAAQYGASASNTFMNNLGALTRAVTEVVPGGQVHLIGQIGNSPVYGSLRSGVGIAEVSGRTIVVRMANGNPIVLGPLP